MSSSEFFPWGKGGGGWGIDIGDRYIVIREMVHRNTAESTNSRVKWWSIFQLGVVGGNGFFQVWYLKRFFEVCPPPPPPPPSHPPY